MNRERLEALSNEALRKLAALEGLEVPDDVERILLIDALLEVFEEKLEEQENQNNSLMQVSQKKYDLTPIDLTHPVEEEIEGALPISYHETRIQFLLRDPFWAYVYWDVRGGSLPALKRELDADKVILRVFRYRENPKGRTFLSQHIDDSFDIEVGLRDYSWYVNLPMHDAYYSVALLFLSKQGERVEAHSDIQYVPPVYTLEDLLDSPEPGQRQIYELMDLEKLDLLRAKPALPERREFSEESLQSL